MYALIMEMVQMPRSLTTLSRVSTAMLTRNIGIGVLSVRLCATDAPSVSDG